MNDAEYYNLSGDLIMGGAQIPPSLTSMEQALKRHLQRCQPDGAPCKRMRVWRDFTPPPTPPSSHELSSDDTSDDDMDDDASCWSGDECDEEVSASSSCFPVSSSSATSGGYRGSILASCLMADRASPIPHTSSPVPVVSSMTSASNSSGCGLSMTSPADATMTSSSSPSGYWYSAGMCEPTAAAVDNQSSHLHHHSHHSHHQHPGSQQQHQRLTNQTVECDGKSYIELGAMVPVSQQSPAAAGSGYQSGGSWSTRRLRSQPYRQQRFAVLHATMLKLGRQRRLTDPRLHKSVLLYNTMRLIERELELEGTSLTAAFNPHQVDSAAAGLTLDPLPPPTPPPPQPHNHLSSPAPLNVPVQVAPPCATSASSSNQLGTSPATSASPPAHHQSPSYCAPPAAQVWPAQDVCDEPINWGSVLSIASQPDLLLTPLPEPQLLPTDELPCSSAAGSSGSCCSWYSSSTAPLPGASGGGSWCSNSAGSNCATTAAVAGGSVLMVL